MMLATMATSGSWPTRPSDVASSVPTKADAVAAEAKSSIMPTVFRRSRAQIAAPTTRTSRRRSRTGFARQRATVALDEPEPQAANTANTANASHGQRAGFASAGIPCCIWRAHADPFTGRRSSGDASDGESSPSTSRAGTTPLIVVPDPGSSRPRGPSSAPSRSAMPCRPVPCPSLPGRNRVHRRAPRTRCPLAGRPARPRPSSAPEYFAMFWKASRTEKYTADSTSGVYRPTPPGQIVTGTADARLGFHSGDQASVRQQGRVDAAGQIAQVLEGGLGSRPRSG